MIYFIINYIILKQFSSFNVAGGLFKNLNVENPWYYGNLLINLQTGFASSLPLSLCTWAVTTIPILSVFHKDRSTG